MKKKILHYCEGRGGIKKVNQPQLGPDDTVTGCGLVVHLLNATSEHEQVECKNCKSRYLKLKKLKN